MKSRMDLIGFGQQVRLKWLERTANLVLAGYDEASIKEILRGWLGQERAVSTLMRIWVRPPRHLHSLHRGGLELLSRLPSEEHIAVHWGMTMAVYPFWGAVATYVGRLLRLQGTVAADLVKRRAHEQYGERDTVSKGARQVLRSFVDWGVLKEVETDVYAPGLSLPITHLETAAWLIEALLYAHESRSMLLEAAVNSPVLFPFRLSYDLKERLTSISGRIEATRIGFDHHVVELRTEGLPANVL